MNASWKSWKGWLAPVLVLGLTAYAIAEDLTLTTYYPSPRGVYNELRTSGNVSIGDLTPPTDAVRLYVAGNSDTTYAAVIGNTAESGNAKGLWVQSFGSNPASAALFAQNDAGGPAIYSRGPAYFMDGNVGIGRTDPQKKLDISDDSGETDIRIRNVHPGENATEGIEFWRGDETEADLTVWGPESTVYPGGIFRIGSSNGRGIGLAASSAKADLFVSRDGNVGIGTTEPHSLLEVRKDDPVLLSKVAITNKHAEGGAALFLEGIGIDPGISSGALLSYDNTDSTLLIRNINPGGPIVFSPSNETREAMRIAPNGNVGIGVTDPGTARLAIAGDNDRGKPDVYVSGGSVKIEGALGSEFDAGALQVTQQQDLGPVVYIKNISSGDKAKGLYVESSSSAIGGPALYARNFAGGPAITTHGDVYVTGTVNASSSRTLKSHIQELTTGDYARILAALEATRPVTYHMKTEDPSTSRPHLGVIAEEAPDVITTEDKKAISYSDYLGFLLAAVKAQQEQIKQLQGEVRGLQQDVQVKERP